MNNRTKKKAIRKFRDGRRMTPKQSIAMKKINLQIQMLLLGAITRGQAIINAHHPRPKFEPGLEPPSGIAILGEECITPISFGLKRGWREGLNVKAVHEFQVRAPRPAFPFAILDINLPG